MPEMNIDGITEGDLLSELAAQMAGDVEPRINGDVTASELAARTGRNRQSVASFLKKQMDAGALTRHWVIVDGRGQWAYYRRVK